MEERIFEHEFAQGEQVLKGSFNYAHKREYVLGIWWYQIAIGRFEYLSDASSHTDERFKLFNQKEDDKLIRGRLIKVGDLTYNVLYASLMLSRRIPEMTLADIKYKVEEASGQKIDYTVDEKGHTLSEKKI